MPLLRWRPETEFENLRREMDRMMRDTERLFATFLPTARPAERRPEIAAAWLPPCDIHVKESECIIQCDLAGADPNNVEVNCTKDAINISGEVKDELCKDADCALHERSTGRFWRKVDLPEEINSDQVKAQFRNGLLTIRAPLAETARRRPHKVAIEAAR